FFGAFVFQMRPRLSCSLCTRSPAELFVRLLLLLGNPFQVLFSRLTRNCPKGSARTERRAYNHESHLRSLLHVGCPQYPKVFYLVGLVVLLSYLSFLRGFLCEQLRIETVVVHKVF